MATIFELSRMTLYRFSKQVKIPVSELDTELVSYLVGNHRDLRKAYKELKFAKTIKKVAGKSGMKSSEDVLSVLEIPRHKHECFSNNYNFVKEHQ